jgi:hypothetical protein
MCRNSRSVLAIGSLVVAGTSGCMVVPVASDGTPIYPSATAYYPAIAVPTVQGPGPNFLAPVPGRSARPPNQAQAAAYMPPAQAAVYVPPRPDQMAPAASAGPSAPAPLQARLYPSNEVATQIGMLSGTVTNMMTGKGFFELNYKGEVLSGEATRVPGDERRGVANAYGQRGTFMSCDYRMTTPYQGTGTCSLSTGAQYQVHIGG